MAVSCTPQDLITNATQFCCITGDNLQQSVQLYLLRHIAGLDSMTPQELVAASKCFLSCVPDGAYKAVKSYLLCQIANAAPVGEGNGLIWGPNPETVTNLNGDNDSVTLFLQLSTGENYTTLSYGNPVNVTNSVDFRLLNAATQVTFRLLETVGLSVIFSNSNTLERVEAPNLVSIGGDLFLDAITNLTDFNFDSLQTVGQDIIFDNSGAAPLVVEFPALQSAGGISLGGSTVETFSAPAMTSYPAPNGIVADSTLLTLSIPSCVDDGAGQLDTDLANMFGLVTLNLAGLTAVTGDLTLGNPPNLASVNLDSLVSTGASLQGVGLTALTSISLPSLTTTTDFDFSASTNLSSVSAPVWMPTNGVNVLFNGCALDATSVNHILARCVANPAFVTGNVDLSGGTSAAPSGQGALDVITLTGRGVTVTTN